MNELCGGGVRSTCNNLDCLAVGWLNQPFNLSDAQERLARKAIERKLAWHFKTTASLDARL
ncbi:MAG: hypothetical protein AAGH65_12385 [Pseudomonadota bacterium]